VGGVPPDSVGLDSGSSLGEEEGDWAAPKADGEGATLGGGVASGPEGDGW
jgi:hypothetical protein